MALDGLLMTEAPDGLVLARKFEYRRAQFQHACAMNRERVVSKRWGSPYRSGREET
ncbi:hypothetical protein WDZ92_29335 [Nostoc sp. NIES-2111]